jgi:non-canonical poly(A) RNA polymerase PAPD5/7
VLLSIWVLKLHQHTIFVSKTGSFNSQKSEDLWLWRRLAIVFMRNSRQLFRSACDAPNAFDSKQALRVVVAICLISPVATVHGQGYNHHSTRYASTAVPIRKHAVTSATQDIPSTPIRYHAIGVRLEGPNDEPAQSVKNNSTSHLTGGFYRLRQTHDTTQNSASNFREEGDAPTQAETLHRASKKEEKKPDVLQAWRQSQYRYREERRSAEYGREAVAGVDPDASIYPALWQLREDKLEMMAARRRIDGAKLEVPGRQNMVPISYNLELRKHLMSVRTFIQELRDCPDREYKRLLWGVTSSLVRYDGRPILLDSGKATPSSPMPWAKEDHAAITGRQLLDEEIRRLDAYLKLSEAEVAARKAVAQEFMTYVAATTGVRNEYTIEQMGSEVTGLALPDSDLDFRAAKISSREPESSKTTARHIMIKDVDTIAKALDRSRRFCLVSRRTDTTFPIINCQHAESGIDIQLSWSASSDGQRQVVSQNLAQFEHLRSVYQIIRLALAARSLSEPFHGGFGSYGLFCLVAVMFHRQFPHADLSKIRSYAGTHPLTKAIELIATVAYRKSRLVVAPGAWPTRYPNGPQDTHRELKTKSMANRDPKTGLRDLEPLPNCPSIIDPANPRNDLGARAYAYIYIRSTLQLENERLVTSMMMLDEAESGVPSVVWQKTKLHHKPDPNPKSLLLPLIGNYHDRVRALREQVEAYGRKVLSGEMVPPVYIPPAHDQGSRTEMETRPSIADSPEHEIVDAFESNEEVVGSEHALDVVAPKSSDKAIRTKPVPDVNASQFDLVDDDANEEEATSEVNAEETARLNEEETSQPTEEEVSKSDAK